MVVLLREERLVKALGRVHFQVCFTWGGGFQDRKESALYSLPLNKQGSLGQEMWFEIPFFLCSLPPPSLLPSLHPQFQRKKQNLENVMGDPRDLFEVVVQHVVRLHADHFLFRGAGR